MNQIGANWKIKEEKRKKNSFILRTAFSYVAFVRQIFSFQCSPFHRDVVLPFFSLTYLKLGRTILLAFPSSEIWFSFPLLHSFFVFFFHFFSSFYDLCVLFIFSEWDMRPTIFFFTYDLKRIAWYLCTVRPNSNIYCPNGEELLLEYVFSYSFSITRIREIFKHYNFSKVTSVTQWTCYYLLGVYSTA